MPAPGARKAAKLAKEVTYMGSRCPQGHEGLRYTCSGSCVACRIEKWNAPGAKEKHREASKRSYLKTKDKRSAYHRAHYRKNAEAILAKKREYYRVNPDKARKFVLNRRSRLADVGGQLSTGDIEEIVARQQGKCAVCGRRTRLTMDHIMPLALGGDGSKRNFQGLCKPCNSSKHAKHPIEFNRSRGLLL